MSPFAPAPNAAAQVLAALPAHNPARIQRSSAGSIGTSPRRPIQARGRIPLQLSLAKCTAPAQATAPPARAVGCGRFWHPVAQQPTGPVDGPVLGAFLTGVASKVDEPSLRVYNGGTNYNQWEFIWNPIEDQARAVQQGLGQIQMPNLLGPTGATGTGGALPRFAWDQPWRVRPVARNSRLPGDPPRLRLL